MSKNITANQRPTINVIDSVNSTPFAVKGITADGSLNVNLTSGAGVGSTGSAVPSNAYYEGLIAKTSLPTAVSDGQLVGGMGDKFGRQVVLNNTIRDLVKSQTTTITSSISETTIITAGATGVFNDISVLWVTNTSSSTVRVDVRDATSGSVIFPLYIPATDMRGFSLTVPFPQTTAANNWTATCSASVADVRIAALYLQNK